MCESHSPRIPYGFPASPLTFDVREEENADYELTTGLPHIYGSTCRIHAGDNRQKCLAPLSTLTEVKGEYLPILKCADVLPDYDGRAKMNGDRLMPCIDSVSNMSTHHKNGIKSAQSNIGRLRFNILSSARNQV